MVRDSQCKSIIFKIVPFSVAIDPALTTTVVFSKTNVEATGKPNNQDEIGRQCCD